MPAWKIAAATAALAAAACSAAPTQAAAQAHASCRRHETTAAVTPVPAALVPAFRRAFQIHAPDRDIPRMGYVRCAEGALLGCDVGANLPCGPADTRRDIPGADAWCRENNDPAVIPAYVTGHASIYAWRCEHGRAVPVRQMADADAQGYVAQYWRRLSATPPRR